MKGDDENGEKTSILVNFDQKLNEASGYENFKSAAKAAYANSPTITYKKSGPYTGYLIDSKCKEGMRLQQLESADPKKNRRGTPLRIEYIIAKHTVLPALQL